MPSPLATTGWGRSQKEALLFRAGDILLVEDKLGTSFPFHLYSIIPLTSVYFRASEIWTPSLLCSRTPWCLLCCSSGCFPSSQGRAAGQQGAKAARDVSFKAVQLALCLVPALHKQCQRWGRSRALIKVSSCVILKSTPKHNINHRMYTQFLSSK